jgi:hypothetical protein
VCVPALEELATRGYPRRVPRSRAAVGRLSSLAALVAANALACNTILELDEISVRADGEGGAGSAVGAGGAGGAPPMTSSNTGGGGGSEPSGGGGNGGGGCLPEESAGPGVEQLYNGSFEDFVDDWGWLQIDDIDTVELAFCGCSAATFTLSGTPQELRTYFIDVPEPGDTLHARARVFAPDNVDVTMYVADMIPEENQLGPPETFLPDADDTEGVDGWRLAEATWIVPENDTVDTRLVLTFHGASDEPVRVDCVDVTLQR